jgi:hypothetical protein
MGGHEDFTFRHTNVQFLPEPQPLGYHRDKAIGKLRGDAALDFGRESRDDTLQSLGTRGGVNRGQNKVAGFRSAQGQAHRFWIAHFADHQDVRIFTQRVQESLIKTGSVSPHLPLADIGSARSESVFDGTLDGDNVACIREVNFLN